MTDFAVVVSPLMRCPACGSTATVQAANAVDVLVQPDDAPEPGDLVICIGCDAICIYTSGLALRLFDEPDLDYYTLDDIARVARAANQLRACFTRRN